MIKDVVILIWIIAVIVVGLDILTIVARKYKKER